jgi:glycopeptide antibiotics resistance protein
VPIGFSMTGAIADRSRPMAWAAVPAVTLIAFAASIGIEFGQIFVQGRTPSASDIVAETSGALFGALTWPLAGSRAVDWLRPLSRRSTPLDRVRRLLGLYALMWVALQVLPLDVTFRVGDITSKYHAGNIVLRPFKGAPTPVDAIITLSAGALPALPIGALSLLGLRGRTRSVGLGVVVGLIAVTVLEMVQVLVGSRVADVTDIIGSAAGVVAGASLANAWLRALAATRAGAEAMLRRLRRGALGGLAGWIVVLVARHWTPFDFSITQSLYDGRIHHLSELPFRHYYWSNYLDALSEALTKILLGLPVGVLLQIVWPPASGRSRHAQMLLFLGTAVLLFTTIEIGQLFLPSRVPDSTDILLAVLGTFAGVLAVRLVAGAETDGA